MFSDFLITSLNTDVKMCLLKVKQNKLEKNLFLGSILEVP
jgi:hypothetical protein